MEDRKIRIGVSSCLLGETVRFNGGHKRDQYIVNVLDQFFDWVPMCPEVEVGMGTPRESVRLIGTADAPRLVGSKSGDDWTERMKDYSRAKVAALRNAELDGFILKSKSPSCGMERVKVYDHNMVPDNRGVGLFARELMTAFPELPVEEEGRLNDARIRENFIVRVFCHTRWKTMCENLTPGALVDFHTRHKFLIMAHNESAMRALGRLVADAKKGAFNERVEQYRQGFFKAMCDKPSTKKHMNVLQHIAGFFKNEIDAADKAELHETLEDYSKGLLPLIVPITLIRHYVNKFKIDYIADQIYLRPHPKELMLLNHT